MSFTFEKERITAVSSDGTPMGFIRFPRIRPGLVNISDITVFPGFRTQGVEEAMMEALLAHLDAQGLKAALTSSFAQRYVEKNVQWKHLLPGGIHFTTH